MFATTTATAKSQQDTVTRDVAKKKPFNPLGLISQPVYPSIADGTWPLSHDTLNT